MIMEKNYDVFISFSSYDQKIAEGICGYLEGNGIRCFVSYRDIPKGTIWADEIFNAINKSKSMIAVFSKHFNESEHTNREITLATKTGIPILPFRIIPDEPTGAIGFFFANLNWIDAFPEPDKCFGKLLNDIKQIIKTEVPPIKPEPPISIDNKPTDGISQQKDTDDGRDGNGPEKIKLWMRKRLSSMRFFFLKFKFYVIGVLVALFVFLLTLVLFNRDDNRNEQLTEHDDEMMITDTVGASHHDTVTVIVDTVLQESTQVIEDDGITDAVTDDNETDVAEKINETSFYLENASFDEKERLAKKGNAEAQYWLGVYYYDIKRKGYADKAVLWWEKSAKSGYVPAINKIAWCYYNHVHYSTDYGKAVSYYTRSANQNSPEAMYQLAWCYYSGHYKGKKTERQLFKQAVEWLNKACELNYAPAQCWLAKMYYNNEFKYKKPLYDKSFTLFLQAAEQNYAEAQYYVGECYKDGLGTAMNSEKAKEYHYLAKKNGFVKGR